MEYPYRSESGLVHCNQTYSGWIQIVDSLQSIGPPSRTSKNGGEVAVRSQLTNWCSLPKIEITAWSNHKGDDNLQGVDFNRCAVQFLYRDVESCTFMDRESYEQYTLDSTDLEAELQYLSDDLDGIIAMIADDAVIGIELPATVVLEIVETAPGMKAA